MPIYMDQHFPEPGTKAEDIFKAHLEDLKHQDRYKVKALNFWYDEERGSGFCLFDAPDKKAIMDLHNDAHGEIPSQIIEVDLNHVEAFLGKIKDPQSAVEVKSAFRVIMFTDLKDSTNLLETFGDDEYLQVIRKHNHVIRSNTQRSGGRIVKNTGDGFMISFGSVSQAIDCSISIQNEMKDLNRNQEIKLGVKIGLNAGEPVSEGDDLFGTTVNLAARLCEQSEEDQIIVPSVIVQLSQGKKYSFTNKGHVSLKGFDDKVPYYMINWQ